MGSSSSFISGLLNVRPGEGSLVRSLFLLSFSKGLAVVFLESVASGHFLATYEAGDLPYTYIAAGLVTIPIGLLYNRAESKLKPALVMNGSFLFLSLVVFCLAGLVEFFDWPELAFVMIVWKEIFWILATLTFWAVAGMALDLRQAKRLFALIGAGEILALLLGGLSIPLLLQVMPATRLLLLAAGASLTAFVLNVRIFRRFGASFSRSDDQDTSHKLPLREIVNQAYIYLFLLISALSLVGLFFIDFVFFNEIEKRFTNEAELTRVFGYYLAGLGFLQLFTNMFVSGRLLQRFGLAIGLVVLPVAVFSGSIVSLVLGLLGLAGVFYWTIIALKTLDESFRYSLEAPSFRVLYQPLGPALGLRVQTIRETIVEPLAISAAGLLLLGLRRYLELTTLNLIFLLLAVSLIWILIALLMRSHYGRRLLSGLSLAHFRRPAGVYDPEIGKRMANTLYQADESEVAYRLDYLEEIDYMEAHERIPELLNHPLPEFRIQALRMMERHQDAAYAPMILAKLKELETAEVVGAALRAYCAVGEDSLEVVAACLKHPRPPVQTGALIGLLRYGGLQGIVVVSCWGASAARRRLRSYSAASPVPTPICANRSTRP